MRILHNGPCKLYQVRNATSKPRDITLYDDADVILSAHIEPMGAYNFGFSYILVQHSLRISGKGSKGAYYNGLAIEWPEEARV